MRQGLIGAAVLGALLLGALLLGGARAGRQVADARARLVDAAHRAELDAAWPVLRYHASLRALAASADHAGAAPTPAGDGASLAGDVPPFAAWRAVPVDARWAAYRSPAWRAVRRETRLGLGLLGGVLALVLGRLAVWPLLRGLWVVGMAAALLRGRRPGTSHGSARWATPAEVRALRPRRGGGELIVGQVGRWRPRPVAIPEDQLYEHTLLVAPNGSGKTAGLIVPNLLAEGGRRSLVIADAKGELAKLTGAHLRGVLGDERVQVLDFLDPALSVGYNPLARVTDAASAALFAETWVQNTGTSREAFWDNAARTIIAAAALHLVGTAGDGETPPLAALADLLCGDPARALRGRLAASPVPQVRRLATAFLANLEENGKLLASVFSELAPRFACLDYPGVRRVTARDELDLAGLAARPGALYVGLDLAYAALLAPLTGCLYLHLFQTLADTARAQPSGQLPTPVLAYLDEFGTLGRIPQFPARMATIRASRFGVVLVVQALHQIQATYGREGAATILTNATTKLCLARVSGEDAEYFSKLTGAATVHSRSRGRSRAAPAPLADRGTVGVGEAARPLLTPDELRTLGDGVLVVAADRHPLLARQRRYYRVPALVRRLPGGRAFRPGDPDPLLPFRARRAAAPLPNPALGADDPAAPAFDPTGGAAPGDEGPIAGSAAGSDEESFRAGTQGPPAAPARPLTVPTDVPIPAPQRCPQKAATPPPVAGAPATVSCRAAPGRAGAPPPRPTDIGPGAPATLIPWADASGGVPAPPRLSTTQRAVLDALAEFGRPTDEVSSAALAAHTGINRSTVRAALRELRGKLGIDQGADLLAAARAAGLLDPRPPSL